MKRILRILLAGSILLVSGHQLSAQCTSAFTFTANQGQVNFSATTNTQTLFHTWHFGDGSSGYGSATSHNYSSPGSYTVWHIVSDTLNTCLDSTSQTITVSFAVSCASNFYYTADTFQHNQYTFYANPSVTGGSVQSYLWKINGTQVSTSSVFSYVFSPGTFQVCLDIATTTGCTASSCQTITIDTINNCNWNASFTHTADPVNPKKISFFASPDQSSMRYSWNFGDGNSSTQKNPVHIYSTGGSYNVWLAISDSVTHCFDTVLQTITVHGVAADSCTASFSYTLNTQGQASFTAISNQAITSQTWMIYNPLDSGQAVTLNTFNPLYTFTDTGYYQVCVFITTNTGCIRSYCEEIHVTSVNGRISSMIPSYPNPASAEVRLRLTMQNAGGIQVTVYNLSGNIVYRSQQNGVQGDNQLTIPVDRLERGQYIIELRYNGQKKQSVFQKL